MASQVQESSTSLDQVVTTGYTQSEMPSTNLDEAREFYGPIPNDSLNTTNIDAKKQAGMLNLSSALNDADKIDPYLNPVEDDLVSKRNFNGRQREYRVVPIEEGGALNLPNRLNMLNSKNIYLNMDRLYDPTKSDEYNRAKMLATYAKSIFTKKQLPIGTDISIDDIEKIYQRTISFLEKAVKTYSDTDPIYAKAIQKVIEEEKEELSQTLKTFK